MKWSWSAFLGLVCLLSYSAPCSYSTDFYKYLDTSLYPDFQSMTRCASSRCLLNVCDDNVDRSRVVVARLKGAEWHRSKKSSTEEHARTMHDECACVSGTAHIEEAEPSQSPVYDVFLGGSCGTTVWRRQLVIPFLKKKAISYYDPQRSVWSENMIYEESIAKERSSLFLFVIDPATVNATSFLEIAYFAARKSPKLVVVFLGKTEWKEKAHPDDLPDRNRTCQLLDRILDAHDVPMLHSIQVGVIKDALDYIEEEIIGSKRWSEVLMIPCQRISYLSLRTRRAARAAQSRARYAWSRMRAVATRVTLAGVADTVILVACQLIAPNIPLYFVILPLFLLNILIIVAASKWQRYRSSRPRAVVDSSYYLIRPTAAIPSPRLVTLTTPLNPKQTKNSVNRSKRFCEEMVIDDGSSSFIVPNGFRRRPQNGHLTRFHDTPINVELACSSLDETDWVNQCAVPHMDRHCLSYSRCLVMYDVEPSNRMKCLKTWSTQLKHFLYLIPSTKTFLSGMVEVTVCVPKEAETLEAPSTSEGEVERASRRRRNDCYQIAYCYLKTLLTAQLNSCFDSMSGRPVLLKCLIL
uniref:TIR domain-containing protein n=1 Tax=Heterorhabditis bacteriophora TaxID=37862 RepID=A0A1I7XK67_HETBA